MSMSLNFKTGVKQKENKRKQKRKAISPLSDSNHSGVTHTDQGTKKSKPCNVDHLDYTVGDVHGNPYTLDYTNWIYFENMAQNMAFTQPQFSYSPPPPPGSPFIFGSMQPPWASDMLQELKDMKNEIKEVKSKLKAIDRIEKSLNLLTAKVSDMEIKVNDIDQRVAENETLTQFMSSKFDDNEKELKSLKQSCTALEKKCKWLQSEKEKNEEKLLDIETKSMRDSLVFYGIPEAPTGQKENCHQSVSDVINNVMNLEGRFTFDSAYRPKQRGHGSGPRPIIVKFHYAQERDRVRTASFEDETKKRLKDSKMGIGAHLPKDLRDARKPLYDAMKRAKDAGKEVKFVGKTLFIDGQRYRPPTERE